MTATCPALLISAPASGQGKTLITAALARKHRALGRRVRVFKTGPDFLDPMILEQASGHPVYQLDLFMGGAAHCQELLHQAAQQADLILVEGVMGLFDGQPSSADLAIHFGLPVLAVIQAAAMAQTFGALVHGLSTWQPNLILAGVLANQVGSAYHAELLKSSLNEEASVAWYGTLATDPAHSLPERHLGLVQANELTDLDARIQQAADALGHEAEQLPRTVHFPALTSIGDTENVPQPLLGIRIAIARDLAFSFIYPANLDVLRAQGAELSFFSPLHDSTLPECDAVWLPGGYPELHLQALAQNTHMHSALQAHHHAGKPLLAECGGMLYLTKTLTDNAGQTAAMAGILPAHAVMRSRLSALGLQSIQLPEGVLRGHTFHYSELTTNLQPLARAENPNKGGGEGVYRLAQTTASYIHFYFASNPEAAARLFLPC